MVETVVGRKITSQTFEVLALFSAYYIVGIIVVGKFLGLADGLYHRVVDVELSVLGFVCKQCQHLFYSLIDLFKRKVRVLEIIVEEKEYFRNI